MEFRIPTQVKPHPVPLLASSGWHITGADTIQVLQVSLTATLGLGPKLTDDSPIENQAPYVLHNSALLSLIMGFGSTIATCIIGDTSQHVNMMVDYMVDDSLPSCMVLPYLAETRKGNNWSGGVPVGKS